MSMTYEDIAAFLGETAGTVPAGATLQTILSDAGTTIGTGWTTIKAGANGVVNRVTTLAAEGVSSGTALLTMDVGVAGAVAAPLLGVAAGVGLYSAAPEFWDGVADVLMDAGQTLGGQVTAYLQADGTVGFSRDTIQAFADAFAELGIYTDNMVASQEVVEAFGLTAPIQGKSVESVNSTTLANSLFTAITDNVRTRYGWRSTTANPYQFRSAIVEGNNGVVYFIMAADTNMINAALWAEPKDSYWGGWVFGTGTHMQDVTYDNKTAYVYAPSMSLANFLAGDPSLTVAPCAMQAFKDLDSSDIDALIKKIGWLLVYSANSIILDPDAELPSDYSTISDFMDALGEQPVSIPGVDDDAYILNPTGDLTQEGVLNPSIDWDKLWDWLMNPSIDITGNPAIDDAIEDTIEGTEDISIPGDIPIDDDLPVQPDPVIPVPPIVTPVLPTLASSGKLFEVYSVSSSDLNTLGGYLWSADILTQLQKIWQNPLEGVIALFRVWATPPLGASKQVYLGSIPITGLSCPVVSSQAKRINMGSVNVAELNQNVGDYSPYTQVSLYLPFVGIVELDTDEVMDSTINVQYVVDFWTGTCVAEVRFTKSGSTDNALLYVYNGNLAQQIPLTSVSFNGMFSALLAAGSAIGSVATGGALAPAMVMGAGAVMTRDLVHVHRAGLISSNAGILTDKTPRLIINRRNVANATKYNEITGYPANKTKNLGNCSGFTRVRGVNLQVSATNAEKDEITNLLKGGVIF